MPTKAALSATDNKNRPRKRRGKLHQELKKIAKNIRLRAQKTQWPSKEKVTLGIEMASEGILHHSRF